MFTGIIQEIGVLARKDRRGEEFRLILEAEDIIPDLSRGESVAVNGVCLTVVEFDAGSFQADVMPETVRSTNLELLNRGDQVNLELPVGPDSFFGGHLVTGHIDGRGRVQKISQDGNARLVTVAIEPELEKYMVDKGSVAVNGVSLTISSLQENSFQVSLIPETWEQTNLQFLSTGSKVNIETDLIGKYIVKMLDKSQPESQQRGSQIDQSFLQENGFL